MVLVLAELVFVLVAEYTVALAACAYTQCQCHTWHVKQACFYTHGMTSEHLLTKTCSLAKRLH